MRTRLCAVAREDSPHHSGAFRFKGEQLAVNGNAPPRFPANPVKAQFRLSLAILFDEVFDKLSRRRDVLSVQCTKRIQSLCTRLRCRSSRRRPIWSFGRKFCRTIVTFAISSEVRTATLWEWLR